MVFYHHWWCRVRVNFCITDAKAWPKLVLTCSFSLSPLCQQCQFSVFSVSGSGAAGRENVCVSARAKSDIGQMMFVNYYAQRSA